MGHQYPLWVWYVKSVAPFGVFVEDVIELVTDCLPDDGEVFI